MQYFSYLNTNVFVQWSVIKSCISHNIIICSSSVRSKAIKDLNHDASCAAETFPETLEETLLVFLVPTDSVGTHASLKKKW